MKALRCDRLKCFQLHHRDSWADRHITSVSGRFFFRVMLICIMPITLWQRHRYRSSHLQLLLLGVWELRILRKMCLFALSYTLSNTIWKSDKRFRCDRRWIYKGGLWRVAHIKLNHCHTNQHRSEKPVGNRCSVPMSSRYNVPSAIKLLMV